LTSFYSFVLIVLLSAVLITGCALPEDTDESATTVVTNQSESTSETVSTATLEPVVEPNLTPVSTIVVSARQASENELRDLVGNDPLIENLILEMRQAGARGDQILETLLTDLQGVDDSERVAIAETLLQLLSAVATVSAPTVTPVPTIIPATPDPYFRLGGDIICVGSSRLDVLDIQGSGAGRISGFETQDYQLIEEKWWYSTPDDEGPETWITFEDNYGLVKGWSDPGGILKVAADYTSC